MRRFFALAVIVALAVAGPGNLRHSGAFAAQPHNSEPHNSELWHIATVSDPTNKKFTYCAAESSFDNRFSLAFARNRDLNTNIVVTFPDARLAEHTKFRMGVVVDGASPRDFVGFSANPQTLVIPLQHDRAIVAAMQKGKLLELRGPQDAIKFALDGAGDALHRLQLCVETNLKAETAGASGTPEARPLVIGGPLAANTAPGNDGLVEPLPLPAGPEGEGAAADQAKPAQAGAQPAPAAPSESKIQQDDEEAARAEAARLAEARAKEDAAKQQAADDAKATDEFARLKVEQAAKAADAKAAAAQDEAARQEAQAAQARQQAQLKAQLQAAEAQQAEIDAQRQAADSAAAKAVLAQVEAEVAAKKAAQQPPVPMPASSPALQGPAASEGQPKPPVALSSPSPNPAPLASLLQGSGIAALPVRGRSGAYRWKNGSIAGMASETRARQPFLDAMLDTIDLAEKSCKGRFSSSIGAPVARAGALYAEVATRCGDAATLRLYYEKAGYFGAIAQEAAETDHDNAAAARRRIEAALTGATN